jgi:hypothetical protein
MNMHPPTAAQAAVLTFSAGTVLTDMRLVTSAQFGIFQPNNVLTYVTATIVGSASAGSVTFSHTFDPTKDECQPPGNYVIFGLLQTALGPLFSDEIYSFTVRNPWEALT